MATYDIQDPQTGKSVTLEGESPPSEQELNDIFSKVHGTQSEQPSYWKSSLLGGPPVEPQTIPQKIDYGVRKGLQIGADAVNYPFEKAGEAVRSVFSGGQMRPSSLAVDTGVSTPSQQPAMNWMSLPRKFLQGGAVAITQGPKAGIDEFNRTQTTPIEGATDLGTAILGGKLAPDVTNAPLNTVGAVAKPLLKGMQWGGKQFLSKVTGPSEEAINARAESPQSFQNAQDFPDLSHKIPEALKNLSGQISNAEGNAYNALNTDRTVGIGTNKVLGIIDKLKSDIGSPLNSEEESALKSLDSLRNRVSNASPEMLSELDIKDILKRVGKSINYGNPQAGATNSALKSFKGQLNDLLTTQNRSYDQAMEPVRQLTKLHQDVIDKFGLDYQPNRGYVATDSTSRTLGNLNGPYKSEIQDTLGQLDKATNGNILEQTKTAKLAKQFQPKSILGSAGSRRAVSGAAVGGAVGHLTGSPYLGTAAGAVTGALMDAEGGPIAGKIIDTVSKIPGVTPEVLQAIQKALPSVAIASKAPHGNVVQQDGTTYKWNGHEYVEQ